MIKNSLVVIKAEYIKQHKSRFHSSSIYFSMLLWPVLELIIAYYTFKPFLDVQSTSPISRWITQEKIGIFIIIGYLIYMFFTSLVDSAWSFSSERIKGTLELLYLTPANMICIMVGNILSSLFANIWRFFLISTGCMFIFTDINTSSILMIFISVIVLVLSSVCWGLFMNSIFLFSRDVRVLYTLIKAPMETFTGVRVPIKALPFFAQVIGSIFPLTWCLNIMRKIYIDASTIIELKYDLLILSSVCIILLLLSIIIINKAAYYSKKTGNNTLF